jgi:hypothetical protein
MPLSRHSAGWPPADPRKLRAGKLAGAASNGGPDACPIYPQSTWCDATGHNAKLMLGDTDTDTPGMDFGPETALSCQS